MTSIALPAASCLPALLLQAPRPQLCVLLAFLPSAPHASMSCPEFSLAFPSPASVLPWQHPTSYVLLSLSRHLHCSSHPFPLPPRANVLPQVWVSFLPLQLLLPWSLLGARARGLPTNRSPPYALCHCKILYFWQWNCTSSQKAEAFPFQIGRQSLSRASGKYLAKDTELW